MPVSKNKGVTERLHLLSAPIALEQAEVSLPAKKGLDYNRILDYLLKDYTSYDFAVIDTPGSRVSIFPVMAMTASGTVLVPVKTERAATVATEETINLIRDVQRPVPHPRKIAHCGQCEKVIQSAKIPGTAKERAYGNLII